MGEAASTNQEAAQEFPEILQKIIEKGSTLMKWYSFGIKRLKGLTLYKKKRKHQAIR